MQCAVCFYTYLHEFSQDATWMPLSDSIGAGALPDLRLGDGDSDGITRKRECRF